MHTPTWFVAFQAAVRAESKMVHDVCVTIANEVVGDAHQRQLERAAHDVIAAEDRVAELEHELAVLRAATAYRGTPVELKLDDEGNFAPTEAQS